LEDQVKEGSVRGWLRHCLTSRKVASSISDEVTGNFQCHFFRIHYDSGVDSTSNRHEYQDISRVVKAAGAKGWQPCHLHVPIVYRFWEHQPSAALRP